MTALAQSRSQRVKAYGTLSLAGKNEQVYQGGLACIDLSTGFVAKGFASTALLPIGTYVEDQLTASNAPVLVKLFREIWAMWFANSSAGDAIAAPGQIGSLCYIVDDQTVAKTDASGTRSVAGRVWAVDSVKGVLVERLGANPGGAGSTEAGQVLDVAVAPAYAANDSAPATILAGAIYDVPTTGAASTITLPASPPDGTWAVFAADGTKNGHTVQYRDATGPTNLTTALTASKRHEVVVTALGGKWFANAYVSP